MSFARGLLYYAQNTLSSGAGRSAHYSRSREVDRSLLTLRDIPGLHFVCIVSLEHMGSETKMQPDAVSMLKDIECHIPRRRDEQPGQFE